MIHSNLTLNHKIENFTYANATARTTATGFVTADLGKVAYQQDDGSYWRLTATTPTWAQIGGGGGAAILFTHFSDSATIDTDGTLDALYSDAIGTGRFAVNGQKLLARYAFKYVFHATADRHFQVSLGGNLLFDANSVVLPTNTGNNCGEIEIWLTRESSTVLRCSAKMFLAADKLVTVQYNRFTGLTLSGAFTLTFSGAAFGTGAAASDITAVAGYAEFYAT